MSYRWAVVQPRFRTFLKTPTRPVASASGVWVATEKIHGAHFVVAVVDGTVHFGKRKGWLEPDTAFFGWQLVASQLAEAMRELARAAGAAHVFGYGELFGGAYPHTDVPPVAGLSAVQTGIWYAPDLRWAAFDILVAPDDDAEGELLAFADVEALARVAGLITPPVVGRGRFADLERLTIAAPTRVPVGLGLPPLPGNVAEGLVLKPDARARPSERPIFKRKIPEFDDARFDESEAWAPGLVGIDALLAWADRLVNPARVASARSKVGQDRAAIAEEVVLDVMVDLEAAFPEGFRALGPKEEERLLARVHAAARAALGPAPAS